MMRSNDGSANWRQQIDFTKDNEWQSVIFEGAEEVQISMDDSSEDTIFKKWQDGDYTIETNVTVSTGLFR